MAEEQATVDIDEGGDMIEDVVGEVDELGETQEDGDKSKDETEDKAAIRKRRVFVHPILPRDLNDPVLKPYLEKANLVISRFIGVKSGKKRGHVVLWYNSPEQANEMAEELKTIELSGRPVTVQVAEGVTVPVADIMEDWGKFTPPDQESHKRQLFVNNLPPGTPKELVRVIFPVALEIDIPVDDEGKMCGHAVLTFENKREAEVSMKNATGIKIQDHSLTMHMVETEEEIQKAKEEDEAKTEEDKDGEKKEKKDTDDDDRKRKGKERSASGEETKRGRYDRQSGGRDRRRGGGGGGNWRNRGGDSGGFGGGGAGMFGGSESSLMGLLSTLQQVQQMQQGGGGGGGRRSGGRW